MKKQLSVLTLLIFLVIVSSCFIGCSKVDKIPQAFTISDSLIFECTFPAFSKYVEGKYYTPDSFDCAIKVYEDGVLINSFGGKGEGPGEFDCYPIIGVTDDYVIGTTYSMSRVSVFSKEGKFLYSNPLECEDILLIIPFFEFINNRIIVRGTALTKKGNFGDYVGELSLDGKISKISKDEPSGGNQLLLFGTSEILKNQVAYYQDNSLYFSKLDKTYSLKAIPAKLISPECREYMKTMDEYKSDQTLPLNFPKFKQAFELDNRIFVQSQYQYYQYLMKRINRVYELDMESGDLTEVEFPAELDLYNWFITSGNKFMVLDEDEEQIREYEVVGGMR